MRNGRTLLVFLVLVFAAASCYKDKPLPVADFTFTDDSDSLHPHFITFKNLSLNADSYEWSFGDTRVSAEPSPVHQYSDSGTYRVVLKAYSDTKTEWAVKSQDVKVR